MEKDYVYRLYQIVFKYINARKLGNPEEVNKKDFLQEIINNNLFIIHTNNVVIVLTKPAGKYSILGADSKKKIKDIANMYKPKELIFICDINYYRAKSLSSLTSARKLLEELKTIYPDIWLQILPYTSFEFVRLTTHEFPKHTIIPKEQVLKLCEMEHKKISSLPIIYEWDNGAMWIGARAGQFIQIDRYTPLNIVATFIRHVVI